MKQLKDDYYLEIVGLVLAFILTLLISLIIKNDYFIYIFWFITSIIFMIIGHKLASKLKKYVLEVLDNKKNEEIKYIEENDFMTDNINKAIELDKEIGEIFNKYNGKKLDKEWDKVEEEYIKKADKILLMMDNSEIMITLNCTSYITKIVDIYKYFTKLSIDYKYIEENKDNLIPYYYNVLEDELALSDLCIDDEMYNKIRNINDYDSIEKYILEKMTNKELMELANKDNNVDTKMYYYSFMKKEDNTEN